MEVKSWLNKVLGSTLALFCLIVLAVIAGAGWLEYRHEKREVQRDHLMASVVSNLLVLSEQSSIRDVVEEKLGEKLSADQISRIGLEIYNARRQYGIPAHLILGLIEKESGWNPGAKNPSGATGLMQLMPDTAIKYYKARGKSFSLDALFDPVDNVSIGIEVLNDKQEVAVMQGKSTPEDFLWALFYYCGKGDTYAREVVSLSVAYKKQLDTHTPKVAPTLPLETNNPGVRPPQ